MSDKKVYVELKGSCFVDKVQYEKGDIVLVDKESASDFGKIVSAKLAEEKQEVEDKA